jgi:hypothetical protein
MDNSICPTWALVAAASPRHTSRPACACAASELILSGWFCSERPSPFLYLTTAGPYTSSSIAFRATIPAASHP